MAETIKVYQALFSRVEAAAFAGLSRGVVKLSGYHMAFYSQAVEGEIDSIKARVQCFQPKNTEATRYQFFSLGSGRVVLTSSVRIDPDARINDPNVRPGAFIAHCLIVEAGDFAKVNYDPFAILDSFDKQTGFASQAQDLIDIAGDPAAQEVIQVTVNPPLHTPTDWPAGWDQAEFEKFIYVGDQTRSGQTLSLVGSTDDAEDSIRLALAISDPKNRAYKTFDTLADGCTPSPGSFWVVGSASRIANSKFLSIDLNRPKIEVPGSDLPKALSVYGNWLRTTLNAKSLKHVVGLAAAVQAVADAFEADQVIPEGVDTRAHDEFLEVNEGMILDRFKESLRKRLSDGATEAFSADVVSQLQKGAPTLDVGEIISAASRRSFDQPRSLATRVYEWIIRSGYPKVSDEAAKLAELATEAGDLRLGLVALLAKPGGLLSGILGDKKKAEQLQTTLSGLQRSGALLPMLTELAQFKWASPESMVVPETAQALADYYRQHPIMDEKQLLEMTGALLKAGARLNAWLPMIPNLKKDALKKLAGIAKNAEHADPQFKAALDAALEKKA